MSTFAIDVRVVARERAVFTVAQGEAIRPAVSLRGVKSHALTSNLAGGVEEDPVLRRPRGSHVWLFCRGMALWNTYTWFCSSVAIKRSLLQEFWFRCALPSMPIRSRHIGLRVGVAERDSETGPMTLRQGGGAVDKSWTRGTLCSRSPRVSRRRSPTASCSSARRRRRHPASPVTRHPACVAHSALFHVPGKGKARTVAAAHPLCLQ